ncbi:hypothetical protein P152DRAFT_455181 [Eremomyces bilateralis CBS 781.70]|uniref:Uncharacterized protein n=1 Tax=Eremomyces bilateralis CBS 781.70 TaxID=1392243 RepID=A0A6G1GBJ7_9PEZI|nr:uncharacterized protein P152DRAFT_455181 [Eremomyces bilateralis CBS 781.70]KAF1815467.1 hypothetical protein P152DRAFT_455181 [Eremomyces bilateralis CBS 781.70]
MTVDMPGSNENILSMERFDGMLNKVECGNNSMTLGFVDDETFKYAQQVWDWVNGFDNRTFVMFTGRGDCSNNSRRMPYSVHNIQYDEVANVAYLNATAGKWKDLVHTYKLHVGSVEMPSNVHSRDLSKDTSINLNADLRFGVGISSGPVFGDFSCNPCKTSGKLKFEFDVETELFIPTGLKFKTRPQGVKAEAGIRLRGGAKIGSTVPVTRIPIAEVPLPGGISIPGDILSLGPVLDVEFGIDVSGAELAFELATGATVTLPNDAILEVDLLDPSNNKFSGWKPDVQMKPLDLQARISTKITAFFLWAIQLEAEVLGQGVETGLEFRAPNFELSGQVVASKNGHACNENDNNHFAFRVVPTYGYSFKFTVGKIRGKTPVDISLAHGSFPIAEPFCFPFDEASSTTTKPTTKAPSATTKPATKAPSATTKPATEAPSATKKPAKSDKVTTRDKASSTSPTSASPPTSTGSGNNCTIQSGQKGVCMDRTACKDSGKGATPGFCLDDPVEVQVRTIV